MFCSKSKAVSTTFKIDEESKRKYVTLFINGVHTRLQLDSASDITLVFRDRWRKLGQPPLLPTHHLARNASGVTLKLTEVKPVFRLKRPIRCGALPIVNGELDRLQAEGIIQPANYSKWAAPIVVVKKANGSVRICADFSTGLNAALKNYEYPLPVPEELFTMLNGGQ
ncbi:uncharacterized protein DEA37_0011786 [Paragonimus westermani]|uniref:Peptidase A2 domain-containing protein n=1 Tax=Paragonimus westermani TaxID=34504 RepID=A0A5J4NBU3_9TREM|nr:uncharacterized protein DEA37_0011786 [Paragonimus westermani]